MMYDRRYDLEEGQLTPTAAQLLDTPKDGRMSTESETTRIIIRDVQLDMTVARNMKTQFKLRADGSHQNPAIFVADADRVADLIEALTVFHSAMVGTSTLDNRNGQEKAVGSLVRAWTDPGPVPELHNEIKSYVQKRWPALSAPIEYLVRNPSPANVAVPAPPPPVPRDVDWVQEAVDAWGDAGHNAHLKKQMLKLWPKLSGAMLGLRQLKLGDSNDGE